jgi:hypothetical protein
MQAFLNFSLAAVPVTVRIAHKQLTRGRPGAARPAYNARPYIAWALDVFFSKDFVQYLDHRAPVISAATESSRPNPIPAATSPREVAA